MDSQTEIADLRERVRILESQRDHALRRLARRETETSPPSRASEATGPDPHQLEAVIEHMTEGVMIADPQGTILSMNRAALRFHGIDALCKDSLTLEDFARIYETWNEDGSFIPPEEWPLARALRGETVTEFEMHTRHRGTGKSWVGSYGAVPVRDDAGKIALIVVTVHDLTRLKNTEKELKRSKARFRTMVETVQDWVWETDATGAYTYASPRIRDLLGYAPEEVLGKTPFDLMPESEATRVGEIFQHFVENRQPFSHLENINFHLDGHSVVLETSGIPFFAADGTLLGYRGVDREITDRKRAEDILRESDRIKTEFVTTAAHEFRTPLTSIQGYSELLLKRGELLPEQREFLTYIHDSSVELTRIVSDLLDIGRIEGGYGLSLNLEPCPARDILRQIAPYLNGRTLTHPIEVQLEQGDTPLNIDRGKIGQVLENLLSNAMKYSPRESPIQIRGECSAAGYRISVTDRGIGMTSEQVSRIFEKFYRVDTSHAATEGIGLGMSIVKHIVENHGGTIVVESEMGQGTTVTFSLPLDLPSEAGEDRKRPLE